MTVTHLGVNDNSTSPSSYIVTNTSALALARYDVRFVLLTVG